MRTAWDRLRRQGAMPRTVNFVTGPSRTGDIEQKDPTGGRTGRGGCTWCWSKGSDA